MTTSKASLYKGMSLALILSFLLMSCAFFQAQPDVLPKAPTQNIEKKEGKKAKFVPVEMDNGVIFSARPQTPEEYKIGIDDVIEVSVYAEPGLSKTQSVRPDGKISLPLVGDIVAYGRIPIELRDEITDKLSKYVVKPRVTVLILDYRSRKAMMLGEVGAPGLLRLSANIPLLEAVSLAGGVTRNADLRGAMLIRDGRIVPISFYRLLKQGDMRQNIILQSNDVILIPSNVDNKVYVLGEVQRRGIYRITDQLSILEAITAAGGITKAGKNKVILIRGGVGDPHMLEVDIDKITKKGDLSENIYLARGDIVYVPETLMTRIEIVLAHINSFLTTAVLAESAIVLFPDVKSVLTKGRLPDIETESIDIQRDAQGNITGTSTSKSKSKRK
jgi:polysaccharide export outer membrane protein